MELDKENHIRKYKDMRVCPDCQYRHDGQCTSCAPVFIHKCDCPTCPLLGTNRCVKVRNHGQLKCPDKKGDCCASV